MSWGALCWMRMKFVMGPESPTGPEVVGDYLAMIERSIQWSSRGEEILPELRTEVLEANINAPGKAIVFYFNIWCILVAKNIPTVTLMSTKHSPRSHCFGYLWDHEQKLSRVFAKPLSISV